MRTVAPGTSPLGPETDPTMLAVPCLAATVVVVMAPGPAERHAAVVDHGRTAPGSGCGLEVGAAGAVAAGPASRPAPRARPTTVAARGMQRERAR